VRELDHLLAELSSGDESRAEAVVPHLLALNEEAIPALLQLTHSADSDQRWWAIRVLAQSSLVRTEHLLPCLGDPAPEVRAAAALALCSHPDAGAIPALILALADQDNLTAQLAGNALIKIGTPSVPALLEVLKDGRQSARIQALRALAEIRDHRAIPAMMKVMEEDSVLLQHWAKEGLERLGLNMVYIKPS
jgi:HEAT repeat protein